jgi:hypothetical protein
VYTDSALLVTTAITIYTIVRFSIFIIPFVRKWVGAKSEESLLKNDVQRLLSSVDSLVTTLETFSKETNDKRSEIFLKLQEHESRIDYIEKDTEKTNKKVERIYDEMNNKKG